MKRLAKHAFYLAMVCVCFVFVATAAFGCVIATTKPGPPPKFAPDFSVSVLMYGKPLPGATVELRRGPAAADVLQRALADHNGVAQFNSVSAGKYYVAFTRVGISTGQEIQVVGTRAKRRTRLDLPWLTGSAIPVQSLAGRLWFLAANTSDSRVLNLIFPVPSPLKSAALTVTNPLDASNLWQGTSDEDGRFEAPNIANGIYLLRIKEDRAQPLRSFFEIDDWLPIAVSDSATDRKLDLQLSMTDCGLSYSAGCDVQSIEVTRACGTVADFEGAAVPDANVQLYSVGLVTRRQTKSADDGSFDLGAVEPGEYEMRVYGAGFAAFAGRVHVTASAERCNRPVQIKLGAMGPKQPACSVAVVSTRQ